MHWNSGGGRNRSDLPRKKTVACYKKTQEDKSWMQPRKKMGKIRGGKPMGCDKRRMEWVSL